MRVLVSVLALTAAVGCAAVPPPPKPAPSGSGWRTHHQGYVAADIQSSTTQAGNYQVTTTNYSSRRTIYDNGVGVLEGPRLVRGATVTEARIAATLTAEVAR